MEQGRDPKATAIVAFVTRQLAAGRSKEVVVADLIAHGYDRATVDPVVAHIHESLQSQQRSARLKGTLLRWVGVFAAFLLLNAILYGAQAVYHRGHVQQAEQLERELDDLEAQLASLDQTLSSKYAEGERIDELGARLDAPDTNYSTRSAYLSDLDRYNTLVEGWNERLPLLNQEAAQRDSVTDQFNLLVDDYNDVAQRAYSRWYLIPLPGGRRHTTRTGRE